MVNSVRAYPILLSRKFLRHMKVVRICYDEGMKKSDNTSLQKSILRIAAGTAAILLIPLIAMQFTSEVDWDETDFIIIGILLFSAGLIYELIARKAQTRKRRLVIGAVIAAIVLYIWAELAVGIFTNLGS